MPGLWQPLDVIDMDFSRAENRRAAAADANVESRLPDLEAILDISIPSANANDAEWLEFHNNVESISRDWTGSKVRFDSPLMGFLAYLAKHNPRLTMTLVDEGVIDLTAFDLLVQMGLLQNWDELPASPDTVLLSSRIGLLRLGINHGIDHAMRQAADAFLRLSKDDRKAEVSLVNLRFALEAMTDAQRASILQMLESNEISFFLGDIRQLKDVYPDRDLLALIELKDPGRRQYAYHHIDAALIGNIESIEIILASFRRSIQSGGRDSSIGYCTICALALSSDGLLGQPLVDAALAGATRVEQHGDTPVIVTRGLQ